MEVHNSYNDKTADGTPIANHSDHLKSVKPLRRIFGKLAVRVFDDGLKVLNKRALLNFEKNTNAVVLDLGTGDSKLLHYFNHKISSNNLNAIDFITDNEAKNTNVLVANLEHGLPINDSSCDVVISSQNIEHIIDVPLYCSEINRVLKRGGYAIILTENLSSWINIAALVMGWIPFSMTNMFGKPIGNPCVWHAELHNDKEFAEAYEKKYWGALGHQRVLTLRALTQLFTERGFTIENTFAGGYAIFFSWLQGLFSSIDKKHSHFIGIKIRKPLV